MGHMTLVFPYKCSWWGFFWAQLSSCIHPGCLVRLFFFFPYNELNISGTTFSKLNRARRYGWHKTIYLKSNCRGWGDVPAVKIFTVLAEDPSWVPVIHFGQLTTANNSTYRGVSALFWPLWHYIHLHTHPPSHTQLK